MRLVSGMTARGYWGRGQEIKGEDGVKNVKAQHMIQTCVGAKESAKFAGKSGTWQRFGGKTLPMQLEQEKLRVLSLLPSNQHLHHLLQPKKKPKKLNNQKRTRSTGSKRKRRRKKKKEEEEAKRAAEAKSAQTAAHTVSSGSSTEEDSPRRPGSFEARSSRFLGAQAVAKKALFQSLSELSEEEVAEFGREIDRCYRAKVAVEDDDSAVIFGDLHSKLAGGRSSKESIMLDSVCSRGIVAQSIVSEAGVIVQCDQLTLLNKKAFPVQKKI